MLCLGCIQVPGSEAEQENEEEEKEEQEEKGSLITEHGPQNKDVRTLHVGIHKQVQVVWSPPCRKACDTWWSFCFLPAGLFLLGS